ncbi:transposable element Tcb1 transposase [Trichonephila clavipes]|nr:transposable element Tcb1 transposase [Trichonephila clavipes]
MVLGLNSSCATYESVNLITKLPRPGPSKDFLRPCTHSKTTSDAFTRGRIIGKLEEGRSVTSGRESNCSQHRFTTLRQFQTTGTAIQGFSSGRPRGTTPADDRYIVYRPEETGGRQREKSLDTTQATGRPISRFTVARRLHGGGLFARRPVCTFLPIGEGVVVCGAENTGIERQLENLTDETGFSLSSDSHRIHLERGSRDHPSNIIERDRETLGTLPPVTIRELRLALQDEWAAMPQQLIDTLILSCETCLAVRGEHIPY